MTTSCLTLIEALEQAAHGERGIVFIGPGADSRLAYRQLYENALSILRHLQERGMQAGDLLLLQIEEPDLFLPFFWGSLLGGIVPVPVTVGTTPEQRAKVRRIWELAGHPYLIASRKAALSMADGEFEGKLWTVDSFQANASAFGVVYAARPDDLAFIQFSSGSTGDPKGVMLTHRNLLTNIAAMAAGSNVTSDDRPLGWMPLTHDMGLIGFHLVPVVCGMDHWLMPPALFMLRPRLWLQKAHEYRITQLGAPNFGYKHVLNHLAASDADRWDLSCVKLIFNGAEPISTTLADEFLTRMEPFGLKRQAMFPVYGMAEAGLAITFPPVEEELLTVYVEREAIGIGSEVRYGSGASGTTIGFADVGVPVNGCEVRICGESNLPLGEHRIGQIQIRGGNVTKGYYRNEAATRNLTTADGWLHTGDIGFMRNGRLVITGRRKDIIFIGGRNYFPNDLEQLAQDVEGIEFGKIAIGGAAHAASGTEELIAFVQYRGTEDDFVSIARRLRRHFSRSAGLHLACVIPVRQIPKTTSGKPQRYKLIERYIGGEFADWVRQYRLLADSPETSESEGTPDEVESELAGIWAEVAGFPIGLRESFYDVGMDSLKASSLVARIHQRFQVELSAKDLAGHDSIRALAERIRRSEIAPYVPIDKAGPSAHDPVSPTQRRMYWQERFGETGTAYNMPFAAKLAGNVDAARLERALQDLVGRHEALRTTYGMIGGEVRQFVHPSASVPFSRLTVDEERLSEWIGQWLQPFDLHKLPILRSALVQVRADQPYCILLIDVHHAACDGISANLMLQELFQLYRGIEPPPLGLQYRDYAVWLNRQQEEEEEGKRAAEAYWARRLAGELPELNLPADFRRPEHRTFDGNLIRVRVPERLASRAQAWIRKEKISLHSFLISLYSLLLHKYARQDDIIVGALVAGRNHPDLTEVIGAFIDYVPIRFRIDPALAWADYARNSHQEIQSDLACLQLPYEELAELTERPTHPARNPLFDTMVVLHNQADLSSVLEDGDLTATHYPLPGGTAKLDLKLDVYLLGATEWELAWEYNTNLFRQETIERLADHFLQLAEQAVEKPRTALADLELLSVAERERQLRTLHLPSESLAGAGLPHQWIEERAASSPDRTAATFDGGVAMTYGELNARANRLARTLRRLGVRPDSIVPIAAARSLQMIVGITAIWKAGGAYLPIAPDLPAERIRYMLEDAGAELLLVQNGELGDLPFDGIVLRLDDELLYEGEDSDLPAWAGPGNLAYVIYTSGSTGLPKGVMIEHRSIVNRIAWMQRAYPIGEDDVVLQKTAFTFDVSVWELIWWACAGASVHFLVPGGEKEPEAILRAVERHRVSTMHFVPSMLQLFMNGLEERPERLEALRSLRLVFASGEALPLRLAERFNALLRERCGARLVNLYGPTEAAVDVTHFDCSTGEALDSVPIGKPIAGMHLFVVDEALRLLPPGVPGELCIAGVGVARGYWNRPELTERHFVPNPFAPGERMYRTGDLAKLRADGQFEYLGRLDHQVKIRGYRIELGEIEYQLLGHEAVREAVVLAKAVEGEAPELYAFVVAARKIGGPELRSHLARRLPEYMLPAFFTQLDRMPLSSSGKTDRRALEGLDANAYSGRTYVPPQTEAQVRLAGIWEQLLRTERVGLEDDFFALGGHSLKAAQLIKAVSGAFQVELDLQEIFRAPNVRTMADLIGSKSRALETPIPPADRRDRYPLTSAQSRLYLLHQFGETGTAYHLPVALLSKDPIDPVRLERTLRALIARHESLRTSFELADGTPVQRVHADVPFVLDVETVADEAAAENAFHAFVRPFDLSGAPLFRAGLRRLPDGDQLLLFDIHHIVSDGLSMGVLVRDFIELYEGRELPDLPIQLKDFAVWQRDRRDAPALQKQRQFWLNQFADDAPVLDLPLDGRRLPVRTYEGDEFSFHFEPEETNGLIRLASESQSTLYMVLLAVFNVLLARYSGQDDVIVGSPVAGRPHADLDGVVGMLVQTIPLRNFPSADKPFADLLAEVKNHALAALANQEWPLEELVGELSLSRDTGRNPLFDVMFAMQNMDIPELKLGTSGWRRLDLPRRLAKFDLTLEATERDDGLACRFEYAAHLFKPETIERMARHFRALAAAAAAAPQTPIGELEMLSTLERERMAHAISDSACEYPLDRPLHRWFEEEAQRRPDRTALRWDGGELIYGELNARANRLARELAKRGLGPNRVAAIMAVRSPEMMTAVLAVLKAGGAYLPISPDDPDERIAYLLEDSGAEQLLVQRCWMSKVPAGRIAIDLDGFAELPGESTNLPAVAGPGDLAYMIYTSGSTGRPKGVMIEHRAVVNRLVWMQRTYPLGPDDVILQKTPYTFDVSVWELFWWSFAGASLCLLEPGGEKDPSAIAAAVAAHRVTTLHFVPSMLQMFLDYADRQANPEPGTSPEVGPLISDTGQPPTDKLASLKRVFASGETLPAPLAERFYALLHDRLGGTAALTNLYGPTEAAIDVTHYDCLPGLAADAVPIGKPIDNIRLYVVNERLRLQPEGLKGELCIAGVGLARGYRNLPKLTAEKFVPSPFAPGELLYRTGDLARWLPDGNLEYLGRMDHQVKLRGYRIELGEIEAALLTCEGIAEAAVLLKNSPQGDSRLWAYVVADRELDATALRERLSRRLPAYMIPAAFTPLKAMPLTASGKLDRASLAKLETGALAASAYAAPQNELQEKLAAVWRELLGLERVGIRDPFFEIGGHSLLLLRMHAKLEAMFPGLLKMTDLFAYPTIEKLAGRIAVAGTPTSQNRTLRYIELPPDYFADRSEEGETGFRFRLEEELSRALIRENAEPVLVTLFGYLFAQANRKAVQAVYFGVSARRLALLEMDFRMADALAPILQTIASQLSGIADGIPDFAWEDAVPAHSPPPFGIAALFCRTDRYHPPGRLTDKFDLAVTWRIENGRIALYAEFAGSRLRKEKVKMLMQGYVKLIRWFALQSSGVRTDSDLSEGGAG